MSGIHKPCIAHIDKNIERVVEGGKTSSVIPAFEHDRYNLEILEKSEIQLIVRSDSKVVKVKIIDASPTGLNIEKARLIKEGLKIIETKRKRSRVSTQDLITEELSTNEEIFYLNRLNNKQKITNGSDYKVFNVTVKPALLGSYRLEATIDGKDVAYTNIYTKPDFRIDSINPQIVNFGSEITFTITGKGLNSFTNLVFSGVNNAGITIREFESLDDGLLKVKVFISPTAKPGFRDVGISNSLTGSINLLISGIYIGPANGKDGTNGIDGKDGEIGPQGSAGLDGMGICNNTTDILMIFVNNLPSGNQVTSFLDPVLCNLTFEIPASTGTQVVQGGAQTGQAGGGTGTQVINSGLSSQGPQGPQGPQGLQGTQGKSFCTDPNTTLTISTKTVPHSSSETSSFDPNICEIKVVVKAGVN